VVWFTVQLDDKPGSLARMAAALGERGIKHHRHRRNRRGHGGCPHALHQRRDRNPSAFDGLKLAFEEHDPEESLTLDDMSRATGLTDRDMSAGS